VAILGVWCQIRDAGPPVKGSVSRERLAGRNLSELGFYGALPHQVRYLVLSLRSPEVMERLNGRLWGTEKAKKAGKCEGSPLAEENADARRSESPFS